MNNVYAPVLAYSSREENVSTQHFFFVFTHKYLRLGSKRGKQEEVITGGDDSES